ncbi:MAG: amino acid permease [Gammaproteobacteria bacterium]|nr:amino acid permease [Gammaproteobacteria bacterium]
MKKKALTLPILISLVVGNMIGTGIYVLPASLAHYGTISLLSWVFTSLGAICLALTFAHLNKRYPRSGGPYLYVKQAYGRTAGFTIAYTYWASNMISIAAITVASVGYLGFVWPAIDANAPHFNPTLTLIIEISIVWIFTLINIIGLHTAGVLQVGLTLIKIIPLILLALVGIFYIEPTNLAEFNMLGISNFSALSSAAALTFWAFIGLESATVPSGDTNGPLDVYRATVYGTLITASIYILTTFVIMGMIPATQLSNSQFPFAIAGIHLFGAKAAVIIALCAVFSGLGALNACILIQGQLVYAAARDQLFPSIFLKLTQFKTPMVGQILSSSLISLFLFMTLKPTLLGQFNVVILLAACLTLTTYLLTALSEIKFILEEKKSIRKACLSQAMIVAVLAGAYAVWMISSLDSSILLISFGIIFLIIPLGFFLLNRFVRIS